MQGHQARPTTTGHPSTQRHSRCGPEAQRANKAHHCRKRSEGWQCEPLQAAGGSRDSCSVAAHGRQAAADPATASKPAAAWTKPPSPQHSLSQKKGRRTPAGRGSGQTSGRVRHSGCVVHTAAEAVDPHGRAAAAQQHRHSAATGKRQSGQPLTDEAGCSITSRQRGRAGGRRREGSATRVAGGCKHGRNAHPAALHSSAPCNLQPHKQR